MGTYGSLQSSSVFAVVHINEMWLYKIGPLLTFGIARGVGCDEWKLHFVDGAPGWYTAQLLFTIEGSSTR